MPLTGSRPLVVALLVSAGCSSGGRGARDAGHDAGTDAGIDAAHPDTGPRDAGSDAGEDGGREGWTPLPGLPAWCVVERAAHPSFVFTPAWVPCLDDASSCVRLTIPPREGWTVRRWVGAWDGGRGIFGLEQRGLWQDVVALATTDGPPVGAWRSPRFNGRDICAMLGLAAGDGTGAFTVEWLKGAQNGTLVYHAPLDLLARTDQAEGRLDATDLRGSNGLQAPVVSASTFAGEMQPGGYVLVVQAGRIARLGGIHSEVPGIPQSLQLVGRNVLWQSWEDNIDIAHGSFDEPASYFMREPGVDFLSFGTDGTDMAWVRCEGGAGEGSSCTTIELWTAPYTTDAASIHARRVVALPERITRARVSGGWFHYRDVLADGRDTIELWRLADGEHRRWTAPAGWEVFDEDLWCTPDEVATGARRLAEHDETVARVQIASLPVVPP